MFVENVFTCCDVIIFTEQVELIQQEFRISKTKRSSDEIEDEAGLDLDTYVFPKRNRAMKNDDKMDQFIMQRCIPLQDDEEQFLTLNTMEQFFIQELIKEHKKPVCNYRWMLQDNFETYYSSKQEMGKCFECRPFNDLLTVAEFEEAVNVSRAKLLDSILTAFFRTVHNLE